MVAYQLRAKLRPPKIGRPGITQLPMPEPRFDLTKTPGFETEESVAEEDRYRAGRLRRWAAKAKPRQARALLELADAVDPSVTAYPTTPASSRYMRVIGAVWRVVYRA